MDCPRCGTATPADRGSCPDCQWTLSLPYSAETARSNGRGRDLAGESSSASFSFPRPWQPGLWADKINGAFGRRRRRAHQPHARAGGVASLSDDAYYAQPPRLDYRALPVYQPAFDFPPEPELTVAHGVAPLEERFSAWVIDTALILVATGAFFGLFWLLGGTLELGRRLYALFYLAALFTLASLYFALFTCFGGRTPGMQRVGLWVRDFEGRVPQRQQLAARAFGLVVSLGSLLVGFVWAAVDEQHLTWHDHISGTFLTDRTHL